MIGKPSALFEQLSGKFGGNTGSVAMPDKNGRTLIRDMVIPAFPNSSKQQEINSAFSWAAAQWSTLTSGQVIAWNAQAQNVQRSGRLNENYKLSGFQYFVATNVIRRIEGQAILATPTTPTVLAAPTIPTVEDDAGDIVLSADTALNPADGFFYFRISKALGSPNRKGRFNDVSSAGQSIADSIVPIVNGQTNFTISAANTVLSVGDYVAVEVRVYDDNYLLTSNVFVDNIEIQLP